MKIFYLPLENYVERYTHQWSAPVTGWVERQLIEMGVDYQRIDPAAHGKKQIEVGSVVDPIQRTSFCFRQVEEILRLAVAGEIKDDDVVYFDDFWTPGFEAIPYTFHQLGLKTKLFSYLHAQSVDEYDFTYPMRDWIRNVERGFGNALTGVFVACPMLQTKLKDSMVMPAYKVHVTGPPISSVEMMETLRKEFPRVSSNLANGNALDERDKRVVYASRWDPEKRPQFALEVFRLIMERDPEIEIVVCTSRDELVGRDEKDVADLYALAGGSNGRLQILTGLTKAEYYYYLATSRVLLNTALQEWIGIVTLESVVFGCYPLCPKFRAFPEVFDGRSEYMYDPDDAVSTAAAAVVYASTDALYTERAIEDRAWIYRRFDHSMERMVQVMRGVLYESPYSARWFK